MFGHRVKGQGQFCPLARGCHALHCLVSFLSSCFFSSPEPKAQVSYCHSTPSVVRRRRRPSVNFSHFRLLLQNRLMDFDETW